VAAYGGQDARFSIWAGRQALVMCFPRILGFNGTGLSGDDDRIGTVVQISTQLARRGD
jgi:hypothetical protein